jgi:hypothetical protein
MVNAVSEPSRDDVIREAKAVASLLGVTTLTLSDFLRESAITRHQVYTLFPEGGWTTVLQAAGLDLRPQDLPLSDEDLLVEFHRVAQELGRIPTWRLFHDRAKVSADTVRKRFGGLEGTLKHYREWLERTIPDSPLLRELAASSRHEVPVPPAPSGVASYGQWPRTGGTEFGAPINFRGLQHAPINEQGVVYLFGMVGYELGFRVEAIQSGFPDCEAKRCIATSTNRWQRVRIEFEFKSSNFRDHGHDPSGCDMIVCWEHDW